MYLKNNFLHYLISFTNNSLSKLLTIKSILQTDFHIRFKKNQNRFFYSDACGFSQ